MADKKVNIIIDVKGTEEAKGKLQDTGKAAEAASSKIVTSFAKVAAAVGGATAAFGFIRDSIQKAAFEESSINKLNNVLKITGSYSKEVSESFIDFADAMEKTSLFGNEQVLNQVSIMKSMGKTDEQTKYLIQSAANLATTYGIDLDGAVQALLGTLNGMPLKMAKGNTELKNMSEGARMAGDVVKYFHDKAIDSSTALETYSGKVHKIGVAWDDAQKAIGKAIIQSPNLLSAMNGSAKALNVLADNINKNEGTFAKFVNSTLRTMGIGFEAILKSISTTNIELKEQKIESLTESISDLNRALSKGAKTTFWQDVFGKEGTQLSNSEKQGILKKIQEAEAEREKALKDLKDARAHKGDYADKVVKTKKAAPDFGDVDATPAQEKILKEGSVSTAMFDAQLAAEKDYSAKSMQITEDQRNGVIDTELAAQQQQLDAEFAYQEQLLKIKLDAEVATAKLLDDKYAERKAIDDANAKFKLDKEKLSTKRNKDKSKLELDEDKKTADDKKAILSSSLSAGASLMSQKNAELFRIGQASAIASATMSTYEGVGKAWGYGPILGPILAGVVLAAGLANVATIASTKPPKFATGGIFNPNGTSISGDSNTARLNDREMVLNMQQQANLLSIATNGGGSSMTNEILINLTNVMANKNFAVDLDGERLNNRLTEINDRRLK